MSASLRTPITLAEFLAWEERQEFKFEHDGFAPVAMTGGTQERNGISINPTSMLRERPRGTTVFPDPEAVFDVIGPSTARTDRILKNLEYRDTPSVKYDVMFEQDLAGAMVFRGSDAKCIGVLAAGDGVISPEEIGVELSMSEPYEGVALPE